MKVLILAGDADSNLGDHAILQATCAAFRKLCPSVELSVVSDQPQRCARDFGAAAIPRGPRGLFQLLRHAARADLVLCGGGGLFQDDDSLVKMPYWAARLAMLRLFRTRVVAFSLGVGPLRWPISRWFAAVALSGMERVTVRDENAWRLAAKLSRVPVELVADPALSLDAASVTRAREQLAKAGIPADGRPIIGVAPRGWFAPRTRIIPRKYRRYFGLKDERSAGDQSRLIRIWAAALDQLAEQLDAKIAFLPTYCLDHEGDDAIARAIGQAMRTGEHRLLRIEDAALYKAICGELALLIAGRMHPAILAAPMGTPLVALSYNQKFEGFFALIEQPTRVMPVAELLERNDPRLLAQMAEAAVRGGPAAPVVMHALQQKLTNLVRDLVPAAGPA